MSGNRSFSSVCRATTAAFFMLIILFAGSARSDNEVGIFFDQDFIQNDIAVLEPNTIVEGYLVLRNPSATDGVAGWELRVDHSDDEALTFLSWQLEGQALNVLEPPQFAVGLGTPLPSQGAVPLASCQMMVHEVRPVSISLHPIYYHPSIPESMVYVSGGDPGVMIPMSPITGEPEVAYINGGMPIGVVTPGALNFGQVGVGFSRTMLVEISNIGLGNLHVYLSIDESCEVFTLPAAVIPETIAPGGSVTVPVTFSPTQMGPAECVLRLDSPFAPDVPLTGVGREPVAGWTLMGAPSFGQVVVDVPAYLDLPLQNTGELPLELTPTLTTGCEGFTILNPDPVTLPVGQTHIFELELTAPAPGTLNCEMDLGGDLGTVTLTATAREPQFIFVVNPEILEFPLQLVPANTTLPVTLHNIGEIPFEVDAMLLDGMAGFSISSGAGPITLEPGANLAIFITLNAEVPGQYEDVLTFNHPQIPDVPISATAEDPIYGCQVIPTAIDFGQLHQGQYTNQYVVVQNTGNLPLELSPISDCPELTVYPPSLLVPPGGSQQTILTYVGTEIGPFSCEVDFGTDHCSPVTCSGEIIEGISPDDNQVGLYFDLEFTQNITSLPYTPAMVTAYLALTSPTAQSGVAGWECRLAQSNTFTILVGHQFMGGDALNVSTPPEFTVGLATPIPWQPIMHLATFDFFCMDIGEDVYLSLYPTYTPSIPGAMAFVADGLNPMMHIMHPVTGMPEVAVITPGAVGVGAPAPELTLHGAQVELTWEVEPAQDTGYIVYRRAETGGPVALNDEPLTAVAGEVRYTDTPEGFGSGAILHYSYAMVRDGQEILRSPETEVQLTGMPTLATQLLANVPNPFNPQTEIRFALAEAGHARVSIYDVSGRLVKVLADEARGSGEHGVVWQGRDRNGRQVPSGAYYVRLETDGRMDHRKIMLLK